MASLTKDKKGSYRIQFTDPTGPRRTIYLGTMHKRKAEVFADRVEELLGVKRGRTVLSDDAATWLGKLPAELHSKLAAAGLVVSRDSSAPATLRKVLDAYFSSVGDVKPQTLIRMKQADARLVAHFDEGRAADSITREDAEAWRSQLKAEGFAPATLARTVQYAKSIFRFAAERGYVPSNPFAGLRVGNQSNAERSRYVPAATIEKVLAACPSDEWRAIVGLSRFAGLRCPSEMIDLRWGDVNWDRARLTVRSPKTAGHEGGGSRVVPIAPALMSILTTLHLAAEPGSEWVLPRLRNRGINLRTQFEKIIARAGEAAWPRLFHNMRASCATDWVESVPAHTVASWLGHSPEIAARHYLQTRDAHFDAVTGKAPGREAGATQIPTQQVAERPRMLSKVDRVEGEIGSGNPDDSATFHSADDEVMSDPGLEPGKFSTGNTANFDGRTSQSNALPANCAGFSDPELSEVAAAWPTLTPDVRAAVLVLVRGL